MGDADWYRTGIDPEPQGLSERQRMRLLEAPEAVLEVLTPEERLNAELMGVERWVSTLDKWQASALIGVIKGGAVASEVRRRTLGASRKGAKKWYDTGFRR